MSAEKGCQHEWVYRDIRLYAQYPRICKKCCGFEFVENVPFGGVVSEEDFKRLAKWREYRIALEVFKAEWGMCEEFPVCQVSGCTVCKYEQQLQVFKDKHEI